MPSSSHRWRGWHSLRLVLLLIACWYAMEAVHELGHVIGAQGRASRVVIPLLGFSHTDYVDGLTRTAVAAGPFLGGLLPLPLLLLSPRGRTTRALRFFLGFALVANGTYLSAGAVLHDGDAGDLQMLGVASWLLIGTGLLLLAAGLGVWHFNGRRAGLADL